MYSATRQWNPGDEFILSGARRVIDTALGYHSPVLYDRNPDVRPSDGSTVAYRNLKRPVSEAAGGVYERLSPFLRLGSYGNSVKFDSDLSYASLAVLAGSPEWATPRCWSFYDHVFRNELPLVGLGLGTMPDNPPAFISAALDGAVLVTTRSKSLAGSDLAQRHHIDYLPCPALLSAPSARAVTGVRRVGVVLGAPYEDAVWANGLEPEFFERVSRALDALIDNYADEIEFDFIAHYIDELPVLRDRFPDHRIRYSFDSGDYYDLFSEYDVVVSTRVHGCGIAASLGIPSISLGHDFRSDTTDGFLARSVDLGADERALDAAFEDLAGRAPAISSQLRAHRDATLQEYVERLRTRLDGDEFPSVDYGDRGVVSFAEPVPDGLPDAREVESIIRELVPVAEDLRATQASAEELRSVLTMVESSKAEMAVELDGARAAVVRLESELAACRDAPRGVVAGVKQSVRKLLGSR